MAVSMLPWAETMMTGRLARLRNTSGQQFQPAFPVQLHIEQHRVKIRRLQLPQSRRTRPGRLRLMPFFLYQEARGLLKGLVVIYHQKVHRGGARQDHRVEGQVGNRRTKVAPWPGWLRQVNSPFMAWTSFLAMLNPRPVEGSPPVGRAESRAYRW